MIILLEELSSLDLAAAPEFNLLMKASTVLRWNEAGFWNKLRYYLPDRPFGVRGPPNRLQSAPQFVDPSSDRTPPPRYNNNSGSNNNNSGAVGGANAEWPYDAVVTSNDSSTSTRSTIMGGSPRTMAEGGTPAHHTVQLVTNPMEALPAGDGEYYTWGRDEHTYQSIPLGAGGVGGGGSDHIYHSLEQQQQQQPPRRDQQEPLGCVDVMLPDGRLVPATLVRNQRTGKVVPLVEVGSVIAQPHSVGPSPRLPRGGGGGGGRSAAATPSSGGEDERQPLHQRPQQQQVTFPRTVVYRPGSNSVSVSSSSSTRAAQAAKSSSKGHLV